MPATYEPIATFTATASSTFTFSSIPSTYTDLRLVVVGTPGTGNSSGSLRFNGISTTTYSNTNLIGNGTAASSTVNTSATAITTFQFTSTSIPAMAVIDIFNYANTGVFKTFLISESSDNNGSGTTISRVGIWRSTSAITTIDINAAGSFNTGTTATLYGIKAA